jgi:alpha-N-acetylglucosamine transferase
MKKAFVSYLANTDFLPGLVTLDYSLKMHGNSTELITMVNSSIAAEAIPVMKHFGLKAKIIGEIDHPFFIENDIWGTKYMYNKLWVFSMDEYDKVVYLDADMLICENIEVLFEKPHMSAVVAGKLLPGNEAWVALNAGLMVVEPDVMLFNDFKNKIPVLHSTNPTDQAFLHAYYEKWPDSAELHLEHKFNVPAFYLDKYCELYDFRLSFTDRLMEIKNIAVLHYWGPIKPWDYEEELVKKLCSNKYEESVKYWWHCFYKTQL